MLDGGVHFIAGLRMVSGSSILSSFSISLFLSHSSNNLTSAFHSEVECSSF